jgi:cellulose synthase/poly-beta-1,6-N-acetylglucosamine synthase-like glycosyltransferase
MIFWTSFIVLLSYAILILLLYIGASKTKRKKSSLEKNCISVIIPFRNEGDRLDSLLGSIMKANEISGFIEFIFVDDHSQDFSKNLITGTLEGKVDFNVLENVDRGKKSALTLGMSNAKYENILTLDADVYFDKNYLSTLINLDLSADCTILPVRLIAAKNNVLQHLDVLEFKSLQLATFGMAGLGLPILANGANFLFKKEAFLSVDGYAGNLNVSSGDDLFLLNKFNKEPSLKVSSLQDEKVLVSTLSVTTFSAFIDQRIRWSAKTMAMKSTPSYMVSGIIVSVNFLVYVWLLKSVFSVDHVSYLGLLMLKLGLDYALILHRYKTYELGKSLYYIPLLSIAYPIYLCLLIPASFIRKPLWKGRK